MDEMYITPSTLYGTINIPPSKSHTHRAILFSMLGSSKSTIKNALVSPDTGAMLRAISLYGARFSQEGSTIEINGVFRPPEDVIDAGNSGIILRFLGAISALLPGYTVITGDASVRTLRPVKPLLSALRQLGALAESARGDGYAPILVRGPIHPGKCKLDGQDSQPVSALLIATSFLKGPSEILVDNPGETPWIELTLSWLKRLGADITHENYKHYFVAGGLKYTHLDYTVPGDFSTAAFPLAAALITRSALTLEGLDPDEIQGDKILIEILQEMGANILWQGKQLRIEPSPNLQNIDVDLSNCIDALPILAVIGCFAKGEMRLYNGLSAKTKESDRIFAICKELKKMNAHIEEMSDGLIVRKSRLCGAQLSGHSDHRIALAAAVAAIGATSPSTLHGLSCIAKTYPSFILDFQKIGAAFELDALRV